MNDLLVRMLMIIAVYWGATFVLGVLSTPAWGFTLGSAALLYLLATQVGSLDLPDEQVLAVPGPSPAAQSATGLRAYDQEQQRIVQAQPRDSGRSTAAGAVVSCGVTLLDQEFRLLWCNDESAAHFEFQDVNTAIGESFGRLVPESSLIDYLAAENFSRPLRLEMARVPGTVLSLWVVRYVDSQWLLLSLDLTQSTQLDAARRDCMDNALHELRTPMLMLAWSLNMVRDRASDDPCSRDYMNSMQEQCRRMRKIIEDLRNLSALESASEPPRGEPIGVATLLRVVQAEAEALAAGQLRIVLDEEFGFELFGARNEIASAFSNLVGNAVRYTQPGGEIRVTWRASSAGAEFTVEDTGIGIEEEHIPRLTERFFQVNRSFSRKHGGVGLGLAIVRDVLARHQATLEIASAPGKGSRFTMRFPAHRVAMVGGRPVESENRPYEIPTTIPPEARIHLAPLKFPVRGSCEDKAPLVPAPRSSSHQIYG